MLHASDQAAGLRRLFRRAPSAVVACSPPAGRPRAGRADPHGPHRKAPAGGGHRRACAGARVAAGGLRLSGRRRPAGRPAGPHGCDRDHARVADGLWVVPAAATVQSIALLDDAPPRRLRPASPSCSGGPTCWRSHTVGVPQPDPFCPRGRAAPAWSSRPAASAPGRLPVGQGPAAAGRILEWRSAAPATGPTPRRCSPACRTSTSRHVGCRWSGAATERDGLAEAMARRWAAAPAEGPRLHPPPAGVVEPAGVTS